jgi:multidrug efflux pump subunit AcrA (membrane-fusion protein)
MSEHQPDPDQQAVEPDGEPAPVHPVADAEPAARSGLLLVCVLGLLLGSVLVAVLPSSWLFVQRDEHAGHPMETANAVTYACPMFCVVMDHMPEDEKCPVCGMTMTLVSGESTLNRSEQHMVGLQADVVRRIPLVRNVRVVGEVDYDETRLARITTRVGGWLETVWIDSTWTEVAKGEPLAAIYSPELYAAEQEYLVALRASRGKDVEGNALGPSSLLRTARRRLELLEVGPKEIASLEKSGVPRDSVVIRAPVGGVVVDRRVLEGASVKKGASLYTVADLSKVWVQALVFESDLPWVRVGQTVRLEIGGRDELLRGKVSFVDPIIDRNARTARVRIEVDNRVDDNGLRPLRIGQRVDAWLDARLDAQGGLLSPDATADAENPLSVPRTAVLRTGERNLVYVLFTEEETAGGRARDYQLDPENLPSKLWYEAVQIRVGPLARAAGEGVLAEYYPVLGVVPPRPVIDPTTGEERAVMSLRRLTPGTTVVSKGNLLLDSQAQLAGKPSLLFPEGNRGGSADPHAGH